MNEQEKATKILFALMVFTICTLALSVLALMYVYVHPYNEFIKMNEGQLISKLVQSERKVHNLTRDIEALKKKLKITEEQLSSYDVVSSKILIDKKDLLKLITKALKEGFNTYEIVESGLESFDAKAMASYMISKYM
jgi:hypothetical protein